MTPGAVLRTGAVRAARVLRITLFAPGTPQERFYWRHLRRFGQRLLPKPPPGSPAPPLPWPSPLPAGAGLGPVRELLVLKLDHIGDFLLGLPALALLRRSFPAARITLLCGPWNAKLAEATGLVDRVAPFVFFSERAEDPRPRPDTAALAALGPFDLAIDLRVDEDTRPVLGQVRARLKAGFAAPQDRFLTLSVPRPAVRTEPGAGLAFHMRTALLTLVAHVLAADFGGELPSLLGGLAMPPAATWPRPAVALAVGSGRAVKNWPLARFTDLAGRLREAGMTVVLLGGPADQAATATLRAALGEDAGVVDLAGRHSLAETFGLLASFDGFVGNDSALGHAAAALGVPSVVVFSGIDPLPTWTPLGPRAVAVKADIACSPCHLSDLALCPNGHGCIEAIGVERVWHSLAGLMERKER